MIKVYILSVYKKIESARWLKKLNAIKTNNSAISHEPAGIPKKKQVSENFISEPAGNFSGKKSNPFPYFILPNSEIRFPFVRHCVYYFHLRQKFFGASSENKRRSAVQRKSLSDYESF